MALAREAARGEANRIRIGYTRDASQELLPWCLRLLSQRCPDSRPVPLLSPMRDVMRDLEFGKLDIGLARTPIFSQMLEWRVLAQDQLAVVVPSSHVLAGQREVPLASLRNETFVILGQQYVGAYASLSTAAFKAAGFEPVRLEEVDGQQALLALVTLGRGVGMMARTILERAAWPGVSILGLSDAKIDTDLAVVWRKDETSATCRHLIAEIRAAPYRTPASE